MFFGKKKIKEKKFIDYVLEDIPFELGDLLAMDQAFNSSNCLMRTAILGPEKVLLSTLILIFQRTTNSTLL